jgi:hypothetical protein
VSRARERRMSRNFQLWMVFVLKHHHGHVCRKFSDPPENVPQITRRSVESEKRAFVHRYYFAPMFSISGPRTSCFL